MKSHFRLTLSVSAILLALYIILPLLSVVAFSFSRKVEALPTEFTLRWYTFRMPVVFRSIQVSFMIAIPALIIAFLVALPLSYTIVRREFRFKAILDQAIIVPLLIPGTVLGLGLLQLFNSAGFREIPPLLVLILAHTTVIIPVVARPLIAALQQINPSVEEAAQTLGATPFRTFREITLPLMSSAALVGFALGFARSANDFIMTLFLVDPDWVPLSIYIYNSTNYSIPQLTASHSVVLLVLSLGVIFLAQRLTRVQYIV